MGREANILTVHRAGQAINTGNLEALMDVFAEDLLDHDPSTNQGSGPEGIIQFFRQMCDSFSAMTMTVESLVADEDQVAIAYTMRGIHSGTFQGVVATGQRIEVRGLQIERFNTEGKVQERWGSTNVLGILQQLGATSPFNGE